MLSDTTELFRNAPPTAIFATGAFAILVLVRMTEGSVKICQSLVVTDNFPFLDPRNQRTFEPFKKGPRTMDCEIHRHLYHIPILGRE